MDELLRQDAIFHQVRLYFSGRGDGDFPKIANLPPHADAQQEYFNRLTNHLMHLRERCGEIVTLLASMLLIADELDRFEMQFDEVAPRIGAKDAAISDKAASDYKEILDQKDRLSSVASSLAETVIFKLAYISYAIEPSSGSPRCPQTLRGSRTEFMKIQKELRKHRGKDLRTLLSPHIDDYLHQYITDKDERHAIAHADEVIDLGQCVSQRSRADLLAASRKDVERLIRVIERLEADCLYLGMAIHSVRAGFKRARQGD